MKKRIIVSAGGTGGHIIPALAVCKELLKKECEVYYIGNENSMEFDIISRHNSRDDFQSSQNIIPFYSINVQKLYRSMTFKHLLFPFKLLKSVIKCIKYIKKIKPEAFIGFGGFVAGPPALAAWFCRCPIFLQEQNCRPGLTNRWTGKIAKVVFLAYEESIKYFKSRKAYVVGNPINVTEVSEFSPWKNIFPAIREGETTKRLLILGGSQGSLYINNLIWGHLELFRNNNLDLIWQTGNKHLIQIKNELINRNYVMKETDDDGQLIFEYESQKVCIFAFTSTIHDIYSISDFVISRGGALSLAEIELHKIPAFVIPLSTAAVNEQYYNALNMEKRNMGLMFEEKDKTLFNTKFQDFLEKAPSMYTSASPHHVAFSCEERSNLGVGEEGGGSPNHITAAENIANILLECI